MANPAADHRPEQAGAERLRPQHRLRRAADFRRTFERRQSVADDWLVVYGCENGLAFCRLGLTVSRKLGTAPMRNRWKRRLREAFRRLPDRHSVGCDFVVLPRRRAGPRVEPSYQQLQASLDRLTRRLLQKLKGNRP